MNLAERVAQAVIEAVLPGSSMKFRVSQPGGEHDFDLHLASGEVAALEVTAAADGRHLSMLAALSDESKGGQFVLARKCQSGWYVHPQEGARISDIRQRIDEPLLPIEEAGYDEFTSFIDSYDNQAIERIWRELRIESGQKVTWKTPRTIGISAPGRGGWVDPDSIVAAVEREATKPDNLSKLARSRLTERHLFVFVDSSSHQAWGPMLRGMSPSRAPQLSDVITHLWAASSVGRLHSFRALAFQRTSGWTDLGYVDVHVEPDD